MTNMGDYPDIVGICSHSVYLSVIMRCNTQPNHLLPQGSNSRSMSTAGTLSLAAKESTIETSQYHIAVHGTRDHMMMSDKEKTLCIRFLREDLEDSSMGKKRSHMQDLVKMLEKGGEPGTDDTTWLGSYLEKKVELLLENLSVHFTGEAGRILRETLGSA